MMGIYAPTVHKTIATVDNILHFCPHSMGCAALGNNSIPGAGKVHSTPYRQISLTVARSVNADQITPMAWHPAWRTRFNQCLLTDNEIID